ncbi:MAG: M10 family metallopeptidase C-terminal domain-containing protein [Pseudomonadota bacterium]
MTAFAPQFDVTTLNGLNGFVVEGINPFFGNGIGSGGAVSAAGDINGDGIGDIVIGAERGVSLDPVTGQQRFTAGEVYVVFGTRAGFPASVDPGALDGTNGFRLLGGREAQGLGFSVSGAGDVNGDGVDDLLLGTRATGLGQSAEPGEAFIIFGQTTPFAAVQDIGTLQAGQGFRVVDPNPSIPGQLGRSVTDIGDFNGDGIGDFAIGEAKAFNPARPSDIEQGAVHVILGTAAGFPAVGAPNQLPRSVTYFGPLDQAGLGTSISGIGDFNGDGLDDLIAMAPGAPFRSPVERFAAVIFGDNTVPATGNFGVDLNTLPQDASRGFFIRNLADTAGVAANAGDVNGDGLDDLIVGGPNANGGLGAAFVIYGSRTPDFNVSTQNLDGTNGFTILGNQGLGFLGASVHAAGDLNDDGYDDVIVGAFGANRTPRPGRTEDFIGGAAYVIFGGPGGRDATISVGDLDGRNGFVAQGISPFSAQPDDALGTSVAGGVDVNGDGIDDVLIGAEDAGSAPGTVQEVRAGRTYVIFGRDTGQLPLVNGTNGADQLQGGRGNDELRGLNGNDLLQGLAGNDILLGGANNDVLEGGFGNDNADGGGGNDRVLGGRGNDVLEGGFGRDTLSFDDLTGIAGVTADLSRQGVAQDTGAGQDIFTGFENLEGSDFDDALTGDDAANTLTGGDGDDMLAGLGGQDAFVGGAGTDTVSYASSRGRFAADLTNTVRGFGDAIGETYDGVENLIGGRSNDTLRGGGEDNRLTGGLGADKLFGRGGDDRLLGQAGNDVLYGNAGADRMIGAEGNDRFVYFSTADSRVGGTRRDTITDFESGADRIELGRLDADTTRDGNQTFDFLATAGFSGSAGELRYFQSVANGFTLLQADLDGDRVQDFQIELTGLVDLLETDFRL